MTIKLRETAEMIGIVAIVASLIFVGLEMQQTQEIALTQNYIASMEQANEVLSEVNANSELWARANQGASLDEAEQLVLSNGVGAYSSVYFFNWLQSQVLYGGDAGLVQAYEFAHWLKLNPAARAAWELQDSLFEDAVVTYLPDSNSIGARWVLLVKQHLRTLDEAESSAPAFESQ